MLFVNRIFPWCIDFQRRCEEDAPNNVKYRKINERTMATDTGQLIAMGRLRIAFVCAIVIPKCGGTCRLDANFPVNVPAQHT